jgi:SAM-dependent methyltransferase
VEVSDITVDNPPKRDELFQVVVAADVIEHVPDLLSLFRYAEKALEPAGQLVITTPDPWRVAAARRRLVWENVDHVCSLFTSAIVKLTDRSGFRLIRSAETVAPRAARSVRASERALASGAKQRLRAAARRASAEKEQTHIPRTQSPIQVLTQRRPGANAGIGETPSTCSRNHLRYDP